MDDTDLRDQLLQCIINKRNDDAKSLLNLYLQSTVSDTLESLLHYSSVLKNDVIVEHLIELGAEVDHLNHCGETSLAQAVIQKNAAVVKVLLKANANIDVAGGEGPSVLQLIFASDYYYRNLEIFELLLGEVKTKISDTGELVDKLVAAGCTMWHASYLRDIQVMECLLERGFNVNSKCPQMGWTALHIAVAINQLDLVKWLVSKGADVNALDRDGTSVLYRAALSGGKDMMKVLLERGADPNANDPPGALTNITVVFLAAAFSIQETDECLELLLQHGAIPRQDPKYSTTWLDFALLNGGSKCNILANHLAMLKALGKPTAEWVLHCSREKFRGSVPLFERSLESCEEILKYKPCGNVSLLELLTDGERKMRIHARNDTLVSKLRQFCLDDENKKHLPYYCNLLTKRISKSVRMVNLENAAIPVLLTVINGNHNEWYVPVREIIGYLNEDDLEQLSRM